MRPLAGLDYQLKPDTGLAPDSANWKVQRALQRIRDAKGTFQAEMGTVEGRNGMDPTAAEDKKRWQDYTENLYKKDLHDPDNHDGVITHLEPDILACRVKWALGRKHHHEQS